MKKNADRFVHAVFCDDIRQELGNKISLMGCYQGELQVPSMPVALAKLCVFVTVSTPIGRPLKKLAVRIMHDEAELVSLDVDAKQFKKGPPVEVDGATRMLASAAMAFSPFAIVSPGILRVLAITEEGEIVGPRLRLKAMPNSSAILPAGAGTPPAKPVRKTTAKRASKPATSK